MNIASQLRHFFTFLAGLGGILLGFNLIAPEEAAAVNQAGADLIDPLIIIIGAVAAGVARLAIGWISSLFGRVAGGSGDRISGIPLWVGILGTAAAVVGSLPSCSMGEYPITGSVTFRDDASGAKAGITFYPPARKVTAQK
jgi:hypothetical protein